MGIYDREYYRGESRGAGWFATIPVTKTIVLINVLVFLACHFHFVDTELVDTWLTARSTDIFRRGFVWELLTATFVHYDLFHVLGNMLFLWFVGREMEAMYGGKDFLAFYLSAAVVSTLVWAASDSATHGHHNMLGASGAVVAVVVLYALYYPRREIMLMFVIPVEMWLVVVIFVAFDLFTYLSPTRVSNKAVEAHLAGAAFGYLYKRFDLRWSHLPVFRARRPRLRVIPAEPREKAAPRAASGTTWSSNVASAAKPSASTAVLPEEQLDARLDEVLAKIAREGKGGLTEEENRVLQEASLRARNRRSDRP